MYSLYSYCKFILLSLLINNSNCSLICPTFAKECIENLPNLLHISSSSEIPSLLHSPEIVKPSFECGAHIVKISTGLLPDFDKISHTVLTINEKLINNILDSSLSPDLKKKLILEVVDLTRRGDEMGSIILLKYHNLIDFLL